ncbi:MAG: preprotein translocase subunit YajC [Alphaproteobacteria bacterium]
MLLNDALAQTAQTATQTPDMMGTILQFALIFLVFYLLLIRPQQKKVKQHEKMLSEIVKGDQIVTGGGILAKVHKVIDDHTLLVELNDEVKVKVLRSTVREVVIEQANDKKD